MWVRGGGEVNRPEEDSGSDVDMGGKVHEKAPSGTHPVTPLAHPCPPSPCRCPSSCRSIT